MAKLLTIVYGIIVNDATLPSLNEGTDTTEGAQIFYRKMAIPVLN